MANSRDRQILNSIINPLLPIGEGVHDLEQECFASNLEDEISDREETIISKLHFGIVFQQLCLIYTFTKQRQCSVGCRAL